MQPQGSLKTNHPKAWSSPCRISIREGIRSGSSGRKEQVLTHSEWLFTKQAQFPPWVCLLRVAGARRGCVADGGSGVRGSSSRSSFALDLDPVT